MITDLPEDILNMNAILSSKLYKLSSRKNKIDAALQNPVNLELVQQLDEYLDYPEDVEEELDVKSGDIPETKGVYKEQKFPKSAEKKTVSKEENDISDVADSVAQPLEEVEIEEESETEVETDSEKDETDLNRFHAPGVSEKSDEESEVKESTYIKQSTVLYSNSVDGVSICDLTDADLIKGSLNSREDTKGVSRVSIKDDELWVYYEDKINLNSVMEPAIQLLDASGYTHLEFNRLARTKNAIVFDVTCIPNETEPMVKDNE